MLIGIHHYYLTNSPNKIAFLLKFHPAHLICFQVLILLSLTRAEGRWHFLVVRRYFEKWHICFWRAKSSSGGLIACFLSVWISCGDSIHTHSQQYVLSNTSVLLFPGAKTKQPLFCKTLPSMHSRPSKKYGGKGPQLTNFFWHLSRTVIWLFHKGKS